MTVAFTTTTTTTTTTATTAVLSFYAAILTGLNYWSVHPYVCLSRTSSKTKWRWTFSGTV